MEKEKLNYIKEITKLAHIKSFKKMKLLSNGFEFALKETSATLYYSENLQPIAKRVSKSNFSTSIKESIVSGELISTTNSEHYYYSFSKLEGLENSINVDIKSNKRLKREFVKWKLYDKLKSQFIIDFTNYGSDLTLYRLNGPSAWKGWDSYSSYNLKIRNWEIHISINSKNTLLSQVQLPNFTFNQQPVFKCLSKGNIIHRDNLTPGTYNCIASQEVRIKENYTSKPTFPNYSSYYLDILKIHNELISLEYESLTLMKDGFSRLEEHKDYFSVARAYNVMVFKNGQTNINAANGMKNDGPFLPPPINLKNLEFIFIYPNSEKAKELFFAFRSGRTSYFPGLERYVEIPIRQPAKELVYKYSYHDYENLPSLARNHIQQVKSLMPDKIFFAIVLLPKSKKDNGNEDAEYYELKKALLSEAIPSQFIDERAIGTDNFVYWLPNIAVAIHAKLGGIPWKLNRPDEKELIVGFGDASQGEVNFRGSTVFFDNSGRLKATNFFQSENIEAFKSALKNAILNFIEKTAKRPERLIIHYFKLPGNTEKNAVIDALKGLGLDLPFIIVTINESKAKDFIAFDEISGHSMPMSGIAWKLNKQEYILFNNTRYEDEPRSGRAPKQEYPIKLNIWFSNINHSSDNLIKMIIGQVFEFSRIYWKSIMQQSKPVTAVYPEMIADFGIHFPDDQIPENWVTQTTPWFI
ncbi:MAG: hypothetical protein IPP71_19815 [Bacteroidetes bacterium]|nr:hypothetical protein [Bacteroidota bacterium]